MTRFLLRTPLLLAACLALTAPLAADAGGCRLFLLRDSDAGVELERIDLSGNERRSFDLSPASGYLTFAIPFGEGSSAQVVKRDTGPSELVTVCREGGLELRIVESDGSTRSLPDLSLSELERYDLRVNVTGGDGSRIAFAVRSGRLVEPASGPVIDLFGGRIPLGPEDWAVTTETSLAAAAPTAVGDAPLQFDGEHLFTDVELPTGRSCRFIVDLGAGTTVISRQVLPPGIEIRSLKSVEYGAEGKRTADASMQALGGAVGGFAGIATVPILRAGSIEWRELDVHVLEGLPAIGGRPIDGILGLDVLGRGAVLRLDYGGDHEGRLRQLERTTSATAGIPFATASAHLFVPATVGDRELHLVLDTGAKVSMLPSGVANELRLKSDPARRVELRGLDGNRLPGLQVTVPQLSLGGRSFGAVEFALLDEMPALEIWGLGRNSGILGNNFLARFGRLEIDFVDGVIRLGS